MLVYFYSQRVQGAFQSASGNGISKQIICLIKPRRAPQEAPTWHLCSYAESVIVGKTLPSEVPVLKASTE
jgi:hypothetical protein